MIEPPEDSKKKPSEPLEGTPDDPAVSPKPPPGPPADVALEKPCVEMSPGSLHVAIEKVDKVLAETGLYYTSAGRLIRLVQQEGRGISTEQVNEQTLRADLSRRIDWKRKSREGNWLVCDPPYQVIQSVLLGQDRHHLQPLSSLARQPFYGSDGRLVSKPGYDPGTGVFGAFEASDYRLDDPGREVAERSLGYLDLQLCEFEFESEVDRSAALCAMLTATIRPSLSVAPAFLITASTSGTGKSCLADVVALFGGPEEPHRVSFPTKTDEAGKLVVSVLMQKPAVVLFDDMQTNFKSLGPLNRALTSSTTTERMLGGNQMATVPTKALFLCTGNNIEPERDVRRRVVTIRLTSSNETPALRSFSGNPVAEVRKHRARMVECALNIIAAYQADGAPPQNVPPIGTYDDWSRYCRQALVWLGLPDPAQSLIDQVAHDPERENLADFLEVWREFFGSSSVTVRKLLAKAEQHSELIDALEELPVFEGRFVNRGKLGWYISKNRGRRANGLRIEPGDSSERRAWRVVRDTATTDLGDD